MPPSKLLPICFILAFCAGCGSPASRLIGSWQAEVVVPAAEPDSFEARLKNAIASALQLSAEFTSDGKLIVRASALGQNREIAGTWKYLKSEGNVMVLEVKPEGQPATTARVTVVDNDHIQFVPPDAAAGGQSLHFKRVRTSASK